MKKQLSQFRSSECRRIKGFTLVELIVTLLILGILFGTGIPSIKSLLDNMSVRTSSDRLVNSIGYARGEAVARVNSITICPIDGAGAASCNGGSWTNGWVVQDSAGTILRIVNNLESATVVTGPSNLVFDEQGVNTSTAVVNFVVSKLGVSSRQVSVSIVGSTTVVTL